MKNIRNLKVYDSTMFHLDDVISMYNEYIEKINNMSDLQRKTFLRIIEDNELIDNQTVENENSFLVTFYSKLEKQHSLNYLKTMFSKKNTSVEEVNHLHSIMINGSSADEPQNHRYRDGSHPSDDQRWVGYYDSNNKPVVEYVPIPSNMVMQEMKSLIDYVNDLSDNSIFSNIFIKPMIIHAEMAVMQPFGDGNTRTARLLQYGDMWKLTNEQSSNHVLKPVLYLSDRYKIYRRDYRTYIKNIAVQKDDDAWNKWFDFNLNMIDEKLYKSLNDVDQIVRRRG